MNIGEAAQASGISAKMIRYYEATGLIPAAGRSDAGYRLYSQTAVQTLRFIRRARDLGFSLQRVKTLLALWSEPERKSADVRELARQYISELDEDIAKLKSIRDQLQILSNGCLGDDRPECPILDDLAAAVSDPHDPEAVPHLPLGRVTPHGTR
jgi:Cu(I)-responsive transcriptional regulator